MSTFLVTITETLQSFPCHDDEAVLSALIRFKKYALNHGCCGGGCGICKMRIVKGEYEKFKRMSRAHISETEEQEDIVLLCCIKARSDLLISKGKENSNGI